MTNQERDLAEDRAARERLGAEANVKNPSNSKKNRALRNLPPTNLYDRARLPCGRDRSEARHTMQHFYKGSY